MNEVVDSERPELQPRSTWWQYVLAIAAWVVVSANVYVALAGLLWAVVLRAVYMLFMGWRDRRRGRRRRLRFWIASLFVLAAVCAFFARVGRANAADIPSGFVSHPELAARVQFVAGKPISVYCATSDESWMQAVHGNTAENGYAYVGGGEVYLIASACRQLVLKVTGLPFSRALLTGSLLTLAHEAEHLAGHRDEHETDCAALSVIRQVATNFGFRKPANAARVAADAATIHSLKPLPYSGPC